MIVKRRSFLGRLRVYPAALRQHYILLRRGGTSRGEALLVAFRLANCLLK